MLRTPRATAFIRVILFHSITLALTTLHLYVWTLPPTSTAIPEADSAEAHWWGLWPVTYLPGWVLGIGLGIVFVTTIATWVWVRSPGMGKGLRSLPHLRTKVPAGLWWLIIVSLFVGAFYTFPTVHTRWGDAYILTHALALDDPALRLTHSWQAPLDVRLHSKLWLTFHERFDWEDAMPVYRLLSPIAGLFYLLAAVGISRQLTPLPRWVTFALLTSIGVMQLFFGYIENYSFAAAGILLYLWLGLSVLAGRRPLRQATLALALTNAFHPSTLVYVPSLLYCGWCCWRRESGDGSRETEVYSQPCSSQSPIIQSPHHPTAQPRNKSWPSIVSQLVLPMLLVGGGTILMMELGGHGIGTLLTTDRPGGGDARWFVPLWETTTRWERYTLFSWPHLRDLLNQQLLVALVVLPGISIIGVLVISNWVIALLVPCAIGRRQIPNHPITQSPNHHSPLIFLTLAAASHLLLTWIWNPDYGGQRDWDLFSLAAIPLTVLFAYLLCSALNQPPSFGWFRNSGIDCNRSMANRFAQTTEEPSTQRMVLAGIIPLLVLQYLHTAAWIYQNTLPWEWP